MYRIDSRGATIDGRFTEGNPTSGTPATVVNAQWMNAVQDEIVNVIAGAELTLDKNNNAQLLAAISALATAQVRAIYPVGSIYINASDSRNPAQYLGFGTWTAIAGRAIFGFSSSDPEFDSAGETGGSKSHNHGGSTGDTALSVEQMPSHDHSYRDRYYAEASGSLVSATYKEFMPPGYNAGLGSSDTDFDNNQFMYIDETTGYSGGGQSHDRSVSIESNLPP
jgi:hypothetical protein